MGANNVNFENTVVHGIAKYHLATTRSVIFLDNATTSSISFSLL
jgi:hypothetical protein